MLLTCFEEKGFKIIRNKRYSGDAGLDGQIIGTDWKRALIQGKRYRMYVKPADILNFENLVIKRNVNKGYFIYTGKTGKETFNNFHHNQTVEVISGKKLIELLLNN